MQLMCTVGLDFPLGVFETCLLLVRFFFKVKDSENWELPEEFENAIEVLEACIAIDFLSKWSSQHRVYKTLKSSQAH